MNFPEFDHLAPERGRQLTSVGFVCQLLQILPGQLRVLMEDTDTKFAQVVDGIGYLAVADAERVAERCVELREEIRSAAESHASN